MSIPRLTAILTACALLTIAPFSAQEARNPAADARKKADKNELPLDATTRLEFETDEGTWISLDVTPVSDIVGLVHLMRPRYEI